MIAFAAADDFSIAETLGTADLFLLISENGEHRTVSARGMIPVILRRNNVSVLFCGKIGMCLLSLLESGGIEVHPGCSGLPDTVLHAWKTGRLPEPSGFLCSESGRSCGSCPGRF